MADLNYRHLRYFREVAREGSLTRAAERINLSQSALSSQIRALEDRLGHRLFERIGRRLELTEVGRIALDHADRIFQGGDDLLATLNRTSLTNPPLRVGADSTLSRNFQMRFLAPALADGAAITLRSGDEDSLLSALRDLALDVVLTTRPPRSGAGAEVVAQRLADAPVALHGPPDCIASRHLPDLLAQEPIILPTSPTIRAGFLALADRLEVSPRIIADVDDMAMVRLLARGGAGLAVAPAVVVADELASGRLATVADDLGISETFYALTIPRSFPHPLLKTLVAGAAPGA